MAIKFEYTGPIDELCGRDVRSFCTCDVCGKELTRETGIAVYREDPGTAEHVCKGPCDRQMTKDKGLTRWQELDDHLFSILKSIKGH